MKAETTFRRLTARCCFWPLAVLDLVLELLALGLQVDLLEQVADGLGAHAAAEVLTEAVRRAEALAQLAESASSCSICLGSIVWKNSQAARRRSEASSV